MDKYDQGIGTATDLLTYYLRTAWEAAGLSWDRDNDTEVGAIIEAIAAAQLDSATTDETTALADALAALQSLGKPAADTAAPGA